tara:strand:- start:7672 stop:8682 length:1011 start_codon:yes stop_codon:yes gene_type:complete
MVFCNPYYDKHERVIYYNGKYLKCIIAVHNTKFGPAVGGTRFFPYKTNGEAVNDVLRLSKGMTYKSAMANLPLGGGKAVIIGDSKKDKTRELLLEYGELIESLGGIYMPAEDIGTTVQDMDILRTVTKYARGQSDQSGDPSPGTAYGTFVAIREAVKYKYGKDLSNISVAVQGLGNVGRKLVKLLRLHGVKTIYGCDLDFTLYKEARVTQVGLDKIYELDVDVIAPCALGAVLNDYSIPKIKAKIIAGAANNQLQEERHGQALLDRGILYAPDYVVNAGGIIEVSHECTDKKYDFETIKPEICQIGDRLRDIFERSDKENLPTNIIADNIVKEKLK